MGFETADGKYKWHGTLGGPHLLLPANRLNEWHGHDESRVPGQKSHYELACNSTAGYAEILNFGTGAPALVLQSEGNITTWIHSEHGGMFIVWFGADSEAALLRAAQIPLERPDIHDRFAFDWVHPRYALIDAVYSGPEAEEDGILWVDLPVGRYRVTSVHVTYEKVSFVKIEFVKMKAR